MSIQKGPDWKERGLPEIAEDERQGMIAFWEAVRSEYDAIRKQVFRRVGDASID